MARPQTVMASMMSRGPRGCGRAGGMVAVDGGTSPSCTFVAPLAWGIQGGNMARPKQRSMLIGAAVMTMTAASIGMATAAHAATCDTTFNATAANGNWFDAANWSNGVPTATSNACIPDTGPAEVTIATGANAAAKTLDAGRPIRVSSGSLRLGGGPADVSTLRQPLILTGGVFGGTGIVNVAPNGAHLIAFDWQGG